MELKWIEGPLTVCKLSSTDLIDLRGDLYFIGRTDEELSLVCRTEAAPAETLAREDGWRGFRIQGALDFSLIGLLSRLSGILSASGIGIFAVSTYDTDYILVKAENVHRAVRALEAEGYRFVH